MRNSKQSRFVPQLARASSRGIHSSILIVLTLLVTSPAMPCSIGGYDKNNPTSRSDTTNQTDRTQFKWSTDVDPWQSDARSWHYIHNLHEWNLSVRWDKTGLVIPLNNPLATGNISCARDYGNEDDFILDTDAPITTSNDGDKSAVAYVTNFRHTSDTGPAIAGAELISNYETDGSGGSTASAILVLYFHASTNLLEVHVSTGNGGETMAFRPRSIGVEVSRFAAALPTNGARIVETASLEALLQEDGFTLDALNDISGDDFLRFSVYPLATLRFTLSESLIETIEDTAFLLLTPRGDVIAAKRLFASLLTR